MPDRIFLPPYDVKNIGTIDQLSDHIGWGLRDLKVPNSWMETKGEGVTVMIIDSGQATHPDIGDNELVHLNKSFTNEPVQDRGGHGTHVAGIVAAQNNAFGVVGVAPKCKIISVKALNNQGKASTGMLKAALKYAIKTKPDVINLSLGSYARQPELEPLYKKLVYELNIPIVCAAGNYGNKGVMYPARYPFTISVGSYDENKQLSKFSSFSAEKFVDFVAPGGDILSTYLDGQYAVMSGTSMAAPFVSGVLALLISKYKSHGKSYKVEELRSILSSASIDMGEAGKDNKFGYGVIDLEKAIREIDGQNLNIKVKQINTPLEELSLWKKIYTFFKWKLF